jgi:prepilin-type N-terminal cleavage/methylation domain-containing protein
MKKAVILQSKGFTLIEVITVLVILGILSGVTMVGYGSWQQRAADDQVRSELSTAMNGASNYKNFNGSYPTSLDTVMNQKSGNVQVNDTVGGGSGYYFCIAAQSKKFNDIKYYIDSGDKKPVKYVGTGYCPN